MRVTSFDQAENSMIQKESDHYFFDLDNIRIFGLTPVLPECVETKQEASGTEKTKIEILSVTPIDQTPIIFCSPFVCSQF